MSSSKQWAALLKARFVRKNKPVVYYARSSIWPSVRCKLNYVFEASVWCFGNGKNTNCWLDCWLSKPLVEVLDLPGNIHALLKATVSDFISNSSWHIPLEFSNQFLSIAAEMLQVHIPLDSDNCSDSLVWKASSDGILSFKEAYNHLKPIVHPIHWGKSIWSSSIPPSRSFVVWRLLHKEFPTDEQLHCRGCTLVSICSLCGRATESFDHLFFHCSFASRLWTWLGDILQTSIDQSSMLVVLSVCNKQWSSQAKDAVLSAIVHIIWFIWYSRNQLRFQNIFVPFERVNTMIKVAVTLSGNMTKGSCKNSMAEFKILKFFNISLHAPSAPNISQVIWYKPPWSWFKCNTDGASRGNPGLAAIGGIFRDSSGAFVGCFSHILGVSTSFRA